MEKYKNITLITQNIDTLHQKAGSSNVLTIHGTAALAYCEDCGEIYDGDIVYHHSPVPICSMCGGRVRPDFTLYGENLPYAPWESAIKAVSLADLFIVVGSSLTVAPANWLPAYFGCNERLIIINRDETRYENEARIVFHEDIADVFTRIKLEEEKS